MRLLRLRHESDYADYAETKINHSFRHGAGSASQMPDKAEF
jgi:hypothetical protein